MTPSLPLSVLEAILLGVVEGLTEYLPVSSTGHLILTSALLGRGGDPALEAFEIVIQAGAILAVLGLYQRRIVQMLRGLVGKDPAGLRLALNLVVAFLPAAVIGVLLHDTIKSYLFGPWPVAVALALGGVVMIASGGLSKRRQVSGLVIEDLSWRQALIIGFAQCLAMWPGTSRSLVTILAGLGLGMAPLAAAEFSFLLALPTLGGATVYELLKEGDTIFSGISMGPFVVGLLAAFASAALAVKAFVAWLGRHGLVPFGYYRLLLAAIVVAWILLGSQEPSAVASL